MTQPLIHNEQLSGPLPIYSHRLQVDTIFGDFQSIKAAIDSITDAAPTNMYIVDVGPGVYVEDPFILKSYVKLQSLGGDINTVISPSNPATTMITAQSASAIDGFTIRGVTGGTALYYAPTIDNITSTFRPSNIRFILNKIDFHIEGGVVNPTFPTYARSRNLYFVVGDNSTITNLKCENSSGTEYQVLFDSTGVTNISGANTTNLSECILVSGSNLQARFIGLSMQTIGGMVDAIGDGVVCQDGASTEITGGTISGFNNNIIVRNVGVAPEIRIAADVSTQSTTRDLCIEHPGTTGLFSGAATASKVFIDPNCTVSANYSEISVVGGTTIIGPINLGPKQDVATDFTALLNESLSAGLLSGGVITQSANALEIDITAGYGYVGLENAVKYLKKITWGNKGFQEVNVGSNKLGASATGLVNDATVYTASIVVDGVNKPISVVGSAAQTYTTLLSEINADLGVSATIAVVGGNLRIYSATTGPTSSIVVNDVDLFSTLTGFVSIVLSPNVLVIKTLPDNAANYIYIDDAGLIQLSSSPPAPIENITLGRLRTAGGVITFVAQFPDNIFHLGSALSLFNRDALGTIYKSGSIVTENVTPLHIDVSAGKYYYSNLIYTPNGGVDRTFYAWYKDSTGADIKGSITTAISNTQYNNVKYGYQIVNVGGAKTSASATGLVNDATVYTASIVIDGTPHAVAVTGSAAQTYATLIDEINTDLGAFGTAAVVGGNIKVTSALLGTGSTVAITDTDLFSTLTDFVAILAAANLGLVNLSAGFYTKHSLYVGGDGVDEQYALVYGQEQYERIADVRTAALPTQPNIFTEITTGIAGIIVRESTSTATNPFPDDVIGTNIVEIIDIRPRVGFQAPTTTSAGAHGDLLGLSADDHLQYLRTDGTRALTGNQSFGSNNITSVGTVNGVVVETHAGRHLPNGSDAMTTASPLTNVSAVSTNSTGTANSLSRSDHTHAVSGLGVLANPLSQFAATTSAQLAGVLTDETGSGSAVFGTTPTLTSPNVLAALVMDKASGVGLKVDNATPTYPFRDNLGHIVVGGPNSPTLSVFAAGNIRRYSFATNDEIYIDFHIPHDYAPNTDLFIHHHWSHNGTTITGNMVVTYTHSYAKGHNQTIFTAEKTITSTFNTVNIATTPRYAHRLDEVQLSTPGGNATLMDTAIIEPDGILGVAFTMTTRPTITGGAPNNPFILFVDLHYQSTGIGTKQKAPNFYV